MFTGLIEKIGFLKCKERMHGGVTLTIEHDAWKTSLRPGDSIAVNGACLTVTGVTSGSFTCDALEETLSRTNLGAMAVDARLNLERALRVGDHVGGHFVSGHVDGVASAVEIRKEGRDRVIRLSCDPALLRGMVLKGSVACDGISLTISALSAHWFEVNVIPLTWSMTNLGFLAVSGTVNIETDLLGKFVLRSLQKDVDDDGIDYNDLCRAGFVE
jgi:riboflavin synthase